VWAAHFPSSQSSSSSSSSLTFCCCRFPLITGWIGSLGSKARLSEEFFFTFCCFLQLADHSPILDFLDLFSSPFRSSRRSAIVPGSSAQRPLRRVQCKKRPFRWTGYRGVQCETGKFSCSVSKEKNVNSVKATLYEVDPMSYSVKWENAKRFISVKKTPKKNQISNYY
jgi:hypothetical protein